MVGSMFEQHIIISGNVEHFSVRVIDFPVSVPCTEGLGYRPPFGIQLKDGILQLAGGGDYTDGLALYDLVANAPAHHRSMMAVTAHHALNVAVTVAVESLMIVMIFLAGAPTIESLIDDQHTQFITGIQETLRRGIVRRAQQIEACLLHQHYFSPLSVAGGDGAQQPVVMMHAGTIGQYLLTIELQSVLRIPCNGAETNATFHAISLLSSNKETECRVVELGMGRTP